MKAEIDNSTKVLGDFKVLPSIKDKTTRQNINKKMGDLTNTINQLT